MATVAVLLAATLAACSGATEGDGSSPDGSGGGDGPSEPVPDPNPGLPHPADDPYVWAELADGLPQPMEVRDIEQVSGTVYAYVTSESEPGPGLYRANLGNYSWTKVAGAPSKYNISELLAGPDDELYVREREALYRFNGDAGDYERLENLPEDHGQLAMNRAFAPGKLFAFDGEGRGSAYIIAEDRWETYVPEPAGQGEKGGSRTIVTNDGSVYISRKWAIRDSEGEAGCVFRWQADVGWSDVTKNLRAVNDKGMPVHLLNATGNGWGPFGGIIEAPTGADIYGTSEQGAFHYLADEERWIPVAAIWYGASVDTAGDYLFIGKGTLDRYLDDYRRQRVGNAGAISWGRDVRHLVSPDGGDTLVGSFKRSEGSGDEKRTYETIVIVKLRTDAPIVDRNLRLSTASYAAEESVDDVVKGARFAPDGKSVYLLRRSGSEEPDSASDGPSTGVLEQRDLDGQVLASVAAPDGSDLAVCPDGSVIVATSAGLVGYEPDLSESRWAAAGTFQRVDCDGDTVVALKGKTLTVFDTDGAVGPTRELGRNYVEDVAVSAAEGLLYAVGFDNKRNGNPVQVAYLQAHALKDLESRFQVWGHDASTLDDDMADTRLYRVNVGADGMLYALGEVAGGNSIFRWDGQDLSTSTLISWDPYNQSVNTKSEHKGYVARLDPATGAVKGGQLIIPRLSNGGGNTFRTRDGDVRATADGRVLIAGTGAARIAGRDLNLVNGELVAPYGGADPSLLVLAPDLQERLRWTTFTAEAGSGELHAVDAHDGRLLLGGSSKKGRLFTTGGPDPMAGDELRDGWFALTE